MGILKRIKDIAFADAHDLLDKFEDPVTMFKHYVREVEAEIEKGQAVLANQLYIEKKFEWLIQETVDVIVKRNRQLELAVDRNEDDIAKLAIEDKLNLENKLKVYKEQYDTVKSQTNTLYEQLEKLKEKYDELQNKKLVLISRANAAKASNEIGKALISMNPENALKGFARIEDEILKLEAKANANQYLYSKINSNTEEKTGFSEEVEKELERLKKARSKSA
jgi:phage shock protein A